VVLIVVLLALVAGGLAGWNQFRQVRTEYDAYRTRIQQGVTIAGVPVGWRSPEEAHDKVMARVAEPYYRDLELLYRETPLALSPDEDLGFEIPLDDMVAEALAASHEYDYWQGFWLWIRGQAETLAYDVPLRMTFDQTAAARKLGEIAASYDLAATQPMVDVSRLTFIPGRPGNKLDVDRSAALVNEQVPLPSRLTIELAVDAVQPDQSRARIESMLATLGPVMERPFTPPSYFTATIPLSTTGGLEDTPRADYTGELTWTFPYFAEYTDHLTETTGFFFDPGQPGYTFDVARATDQVQLHLQAGSTEPIAFEPDLVPQPPISPALLIPPLEARLAEFPGVTSLLVKDLDTGEVVYESRVDYVLSGMSIVKIGIMVEVYRHFGGQVDEQTHQELLDMLGSESCNPCANRLLAAVGNGSESDGAARVTNTMRRLGLANFYLCAPFRLEARLEDDQGLASLAADEPRLAAGDPFAFARRGSIVWTANSSFSLVQAQAQTPRYDRCVRATPREMANLVDMIYQCTLDGGLLRDAYPNIFSPAACEEMIDIMAANDLRNMLGAGIPSWIKLAHKHGFSGYDVPWGDTRGEVGIVLAPGANWLISFYIWEDTPWINWGVNQPLYRDVSNMLYNYFSPDEPYWPLPPWAPPLEGEASVAEEEA
jgi:hypothetical protein